jgi:type VI secretion system secreted protein VgrG
MSASNALFTFEFQDVNYDVSVLEFNASENVSHMPGVTLMLVSEEEIPCEEVVRQEGTLTIINPEGLDNPDRYYHGIVRKFRHKETKGRFHIYEAQLVPSLWLLSLTQDCRIFQDMKLTDIVSKILEENDITSDLYEFRLAKTDIFNKFNIQYNETDLHFISRLLEIEGIFYFFEHYKDKHVLVFCDTDAFYQDIEGDTSIPFNSGGMVSADKISISTFDYSERMRPSVHTHTNYNFKTPSANLKTDCKAEYNNKDDEFEVYSYPGSYGETKRGNDLAQAHLETIASLKEKGRGISNCTRLTSGATFQLTGHNIEQFNQEYFLFGVTHKGLQPGVLKELAPKDIVPGYRNIFMVIPSSVTYRPEQRHSKPMVPGLLSAIVTGPKGEEIWPDEYGRVNVQFHFDREGKMDEKSSCWLRTIQFWNGGSYGSQFIPRIGDEVLVSFVNGDMDYPIIVGSAHNEAKQPNYNLPANKTQSGIKTMSTPGGTAANYNELRFEDLMGKEEVYLQGEKDWNILIKNDKGQTIGHDEKLLVKNDRTKNVDHDQKETIGNNKDITVVKDHTESIGENMVIKVGHNLSETTGENKTVSVIKDLNETISGNAVIHSEQNRSLTVGANSTERIEQDLSTTVGNNCKLGVDSNLSIAVNNKTMISSGDEITLICGAATIVLKSNGKILINGNDISVLGSSSIALKAPKISQN